MLQSMQIVLLYSGLTIGVGILPHIGQTTETDVAKIFLCEIFAWHGPVKYHVMQKLYPMSVSESTEQYARKSSIKSTISSHLKSAPEFVLCEICYRSATLDKYILR
jgi:hypothetical protein